jgi:DDE superfamily endonuclease
MKTLDIFRTIMLKMNGISKPFHKFLAHLLLVFLSGKGRNNFLNMARWAEICEKTFRRNFQKSFDFTRFNQYLVDIFYPDENFIAAMDCSYIRKSGKKTFGLAKFWSGCSQKALKGLEISTIALIGIRHKVCFSLCTEQTPADVETENRLDFYLHQLEKCGDFLLEKTRYLVADGFYAKDRFLEKAGGLGFFVITKLRTDADMKYIYTGEQKNRGRKRIAADKIVWGDTEDIEKNFVFEGLTPEGCKMYSRVAWAVRWKKKLK